MSKATCPCGATVENTRTDGGGGIVTLFLEQHKQCIGKYPPREQKPLLED